MDWRRQVEVSKGCVLGQVQSQGRKGSDKNRVKFHMFFVLASWGRGRSLQISDVQPNAGTDVVTTVHKAGVEASTCRSK